MNVLVASVLTPALAFVSMRHISKAEALFCVTGLPLFVMVATFLGPRRRYMMYLSATAVAVIFFYFVTPLLPPEWNTLH